MITRTKNDEDERERWKNMIFDHIDHLKVYAANDKKLSAIVDYLKQNPELKDGHYELTDGIYVNVGPGTVRDSGDFEAHRNYIDLQLLLDGSERIDWAPLSAMTAKTDYDAAADCQMFSCCPSKTAILKLYPGFFAVFYPQDGHKPLLHLDHKESRKAIFKIPV